MLRSALVWLGFAQSDGAQAPGHPHNIGQGPGSEHGHTHGVIDATIATTERGIWAVKWSFVILGITAGLQLVVVLLSGSVALLADTIHNLGDAATAVPLWIAFTLARRRPSERFTYGLGRVEDLAGVMIVAIILFSAIVAGHEAIDRLINPEPVRLLGWIAAAGVIGFLGNEAVAIFRIRVGRQLNSAALIVDGYHARIDGLTSLAVVIGAAGVWIGYPLADPIIGLLITLAILGIVCQSAKAVFTRMLDGIAPGTADEIRHAAEHVAGVRGAPAYARGGWVIAWLRNSTSPSTAAQPWARRRGSRLPLSATCSPTFRHWRWRTFGFAPTTWLAGMSTRTIMMTMTMPAITQFAITRQADHGADGHTCARRSS